MTIMQEFEARKLVAVCTVENVKDAVPMAESLMRGSMMITSPLVFSRMRTQSWCEPAPPWRVSTGLEPNISTRSASAAALVEDAGEPPHI